MAILKKVTPHTGVWIETLMLVLTLIWFTVTPHTGVWIETLQVATKVVFVQCHAPHGRVD